MIEGLSSEKKHISSKYFYDSEGDALFQAIMKLPEYYLTNSEFEILSNQGSAILEKLELDGRSFDLLEFGAGDGFKTRVLIKSLLENGASFRYIPIDISNDVLDGLKSTMSEEFPEIEVAPRNTSYFDALEELSREKGSRLKLILFLGSSIGNFDIDRASEFLEALQTRINVGDKVLVGFDLRKNPNIVLSAYNDSQGVTKAFNMNLLKRMNRELGADFDISAFEHYPFYDPEEGIAKSYIVSKKKQSVRIGLADQSFPFEAGEVIHTEISKKFSIKEIEKLADKAGLSIQQHFYDCKHYYVNTLFVKK